MLGEGRSRRYDQESKQAVEFFGRSRNEVPVPAHGFFGLLHVPECGTGVDGVDRVRSEQEGGDYSKVSPASAYRPEEALMLLLAGLHQTAVRQDYVGFEQIVDGEPIPALKVALSAAQRKSSDARGGDDTSRHSQAEGVGGVVHIAQGRPSLDPDRACLRVDAHSSHPREIDHQPVVDQPKARHAVAPPSDGQDQVVLAGEVDAADHVGDVRAAHYHAWILVDHRVVGLAGFCVVRLPRLEDLPAYLNLELFDGRFIEHDHPLLSSRSWALIMWLLMPSLL